MTNEIKIGNILIGNGNKVAIQSMTNVPVTNLEATQEQLKELQLCGCDIVRVAVPDKDSAPYIAKIKGFTSMPIVADTHFDPTIAIKSIEYGADKVRINPGNMKLNEMKAVADCARAHDVPIRIGVNGGSVDKKYLTQSNGNKVEAIISNLSDYVVAFEKLGFANLVLSVKSSSVIETIAANRKISTLFNYPLHIGVTEAGVYTQGLVKNSIGIGSLLCDGIGDTIRVSLTAEPVKEVEAAKTILNSLGLSNSVNFVSCPKCGRCQIDLERISNEIFDIVKDIDKNIKIAVMGCIVNGPGECMDADLGIAGGNGKVAFFKNGQVFRTVNECDAVTEFTKEIEGL